MASTQTQVEAFNRASIEPAKCCKCSGTNLVEDTEILERRVVLGWDANGVLIVESKAEVSIRLGGRCEGELFCRDCCFDSELERPERVAYH